MWRHLHGIAQLSPARLGRRRLGSGRSVRWSLHRIIPTARTAALVASAAALSLALDAWPAAPLAKQAIGAKQDVVAQQSRGNSTQADTLTSWSTEVVTVEVRPQVAMRYLALAPPRPKAAVILFAGGDGILRLGQDGTIGTNLHLNFLMRSRARFASHGLFVAALDGASDHLAVGLDGSVRLAQEHRDDIRVIVASVRTISGGVPVWLVGTSSGTLSVVNAAPKSGESYHDVAGVVLASPQTALFTDRHSPAHSCGRHVYDEPLFGKITGPVLVVVNANDDCNCSPPASASKLLGAVKTPQQNLITFDSSERLSKHACDARTPHGFLGIEDSVVRAIAEWIER